MKRLQDQTLYEILEIPQDASPPAIEAAVERARALYGPGSLATYTLMSPEEAAVLAARIDEARTTLLDPEARKRYDASLAPHEGDVRAAASGSRGGNGVNGVNGSNGLQGPASYTPVPVIPALQAPPAPPPEPPAALDVRPPVPPPPVEPPRAPAPSQAAPEVPPQAPAEAQATPAAEPVAPAPPPPQAPPAPPAQTLPVAPPARAPIRLDREVRAPAPPQDAAPAPAPAAAAPAPRPAPPAEPEIPLPEGALWTGEALRRVREARGLTVQQVAERTKVTRHHVENIEAERFGALPAPVYLRGILLTLARELRLDGQKVAKAYLDRAVASGQMAKPR